MDKSIKDKNFQYLWNQEVRGKKAKEDNNMHCNLYDCGVETKDDEKQEFSIFHPEILIF